ncbi:MAG: S-methyl-5-thioribose-1-phosphate isomerase, partial [Anaerolineales bacterium]|nr:S-methyl-5-thioribose-1-phosphate isomerase [Anaerolineales bacterium]
MRTVFWDDEANLVKMIDQRQLPWAFAVVAWADYKDVARAITEMYVRGAPAIGAAAAFGLVLAAQQSQAAHRDGLLQDLETAATILNAARPTAVNLAWAVARLLRVAARPDLT